VISEYHSREAKKAEKAKGADGDKDKDKDKDKEKDNDKDKDAEKVSGSPAKSPSPSIKSPASPPAGTTPSGTHRKYALHRQIWDMRRMEMRKKDHTAKAKEVGKGECGVASGTGVVSKSRRGSGGVVRCGAVWCGVVRCGAVWCGVVRRGAV
jgi:hypothetical protein